MKSGQTVLVSGASGLVGSALCDDLSGRGYRVRTLSRSRGDVSWNPREGRIDEGALEGVDVVIHLAGEPIAQRWTTSTRKRIMESRVKSTELLVEQIRALSEGARPVFILASGINYYGYDRVERLDEEAASGDGFLAEVCRAWEGAAEALGEAGVRMVFVRTGIVLSRQGGALAKMLTPFKAGLGGKIGDGRQRMSWIGLPDLVRIYRFAIEQEGLSGPVNAVAPAAVTNAEFTRCLGEVLGRPTVFPLPALMVKTLFGEMGEETVLGNLAVEPGKLKAANFKWQAPDLESALKEALGRS